MDATAVARMAARTLRRRLLMHGLRLPMRRRLVGQLVRRQCQLVRRRSRWINAAR